MFKVIVTRLCRFIEEDDVISLPDGTPLEKQVEVYNKVHYDTTVVAKITVRKYSPRTLSQLSPTSFCVAVIFVGSIVAMVTSVCMNLLQLYEQHSEQASCLHERKQSGGASVYMTKARKYQVLAERAKLQLFTASLKDKLVYNHINV